LQAHHVIRPEDGGRDELGNLITLCAGCHRLTHKAMAAKNKSPRGATRRGNIPPHPPGVEYPSPIDDSFDPSPIDQSYEDDPEAGIFWGPPSRLGGEPIRWSRRWFDWRNDPEHE
jgi:hypothetical protein